MLGLICLGGGLYLATATRGAGLIAVGVIVAVAGGGLTAQDIYQEETARRAADRLRLRLVDVTATFSDYPGIPDYLNLQLQLTFQNRRDVEVGWSFTRYAVQASPGGPSMSMGSAGGSPTHFERAIPAKSAGSVDLPMIGTPRSLVSAAAAIGIEYGPVDGHRDASFDADIRVTFSPGDTAPSLTGWNVVRKQDRRLA